MGMMDLYTNEQAEEALEDSIATRKEFIKELETIDTIIFMLKYYLATGDALDPEVFGIEDLEGDSDD